MALAGPPGTLRSSPTPGRSPGSHVLRPRHVDRPPDGRFESLLGYTSKAALDLTIPHVLAALAFAISTDYGVFPQSRARRRTWLSHRPRDQPDRRQGRPDRHLRHAVLFAVSIDVFGTSKMIVLRILGVGTALAVLTYAILVCGLALPAVMVLLGRSAWWLPAVLDRLYRRIRLSEDDDAGIRLDTKASVGG